MRISVTVFIILISTYIVNASVLDPVIENVVHLKASKPPSSVPGIWKKKTIWKPRWVKEWKSAKVMKPVWRKVWSPIQIREWVPIPKPPPGWDSISTPLAPVHLKSQKVPSKGSLGHGSFRMQSSTNMLLWDPVPYPDSQQPPPPSFPQHLYNTDISCGQGKCDNTFSQSMNHQQILEILSQKYQTPEHHQSPEYSETVNRFSRLPYNGNNWRPPQSHQNFQSDNGLKNYQELSEFLVPPKFQPLLENNFPLQQINKHNLPIPNIPVNHSSSEREIQNGFRQWISLPSGNKLIGRLITKESKQPDKFQTPDVELHVKNDHNPLSQSSNIDLGEKSVNQTSSTGLRTLADGDVIQEAQLVGEFHYSEFDLPYLQSEYEPRINLKKKEEVTSRPQQSEKTPNQKPKSNQQFVVENKPKQIQKEINHVPVQSAIPVQIKRPEFHSTQDKLRLQKKNISEFGSNSNRNFPQEITPIYKNPQNLNLTTAKHQKLTASTLVVQEKSFPQNHPLTKLTAVNTAEFQREKEIYPVFDVPKQVNPTSVPSNHRFFQSSDAKLQEKSLSSNNSIKLVPITTKSEKPLLDQNDRVQLVFATTPDDRVHPNEDLQKTTTTEPYEIIFSSSSISTTEKTTKSPLIIVTPANSNKSGLVMSI